MSSDGGRREQVVNTVSNTDPPEYAKPYLTSLLERADAEYGSNRPNYFPNSTVVPFAPQSELALRMTEQEALAGSPITTNAQDLANRTIMGDFVMASNPYFQNAYQAAANPVIQNINSQFSKAGRLGSGANADVLSRSLADLSGSMAYKNFSDERARQMATAGAAQGFRDMSFADPSRLAQVGAAREQMSQAQLQDEINRFNFDQNVERQKLQDYAALVRGGTLGGTSTTQQPTYYNPAANYLGLGLGAAALGNALLPGQGGLLGRIGL
jgi:hypothetical protein